MNNSAQKIAMTVLETDRLLIRQLTTEGAQACRDHAFQELGCERLIAITDPEHIASQRVAEKIGMVLERETVWRGEKVRIHTMNRP